MGATPPIPQGTFDPANVVVSYAGSTILGFAKGSAIKVTLDSPAWTDDVGANGDVVRVRNNDNRGSIELELMQSSPSNDFLAARLAIDTATGLGSAPVEVADLNGRSLAHGLYAWIEKAPDAEYGTEATSRMWKIRVGRLVHVVGGTF